MYPRLVSLNGRDHKLQGSQLSQSETLPLRGAAFPHGKKAGDGNRARTQQLPGGADARLGGGINRVAL